MIFHTLRTFTIIGLLCHNTLNQAAHTPENAKALYLKLPSPIKADNSNNKSPIFKIEFTAIQRWNPKVKNLEKSPNASNNLPNEKPYIFSRPHSPATQKHEKGLGDKDLDINWMPVTYYFQKNPKPGQKLTSSPCYNQR